MERHKVLAVSVAKGRIGYVFLIGEELRDWGLSVKAYKSKSHLATWFQDQINYLTPEIVVTERITSRCRKGRRSKRLTRMLASIAENNVVLDVAVPRPRVHGCKYTEARTIVKRYPELKGWLPKKRRYFEDEPRNTIIFEALALAEAALSGPPEGNGR